MTRYLKDFIHNCIIHPLMMLPFLTADQATDLHDRNVEWAYGKALFDEVTIESFLWIKKLSTNQLLKLTAFIKEELKNRDI